MSKKITYAKSIVVVGMVLILEINYYYMLIDDLDNVH